MRRIVWTLAFAFGCPNRDDDGELPKDQTADTDDTGPTDSPPTPTDPEVRCGEAVPPPSTSTIPLAKYVPQIDGGEMFLGYSSNLTVTQVPAGATIELYLGTRLKEQPCTAPCSGVEDPVLYATATADGNGGAIFSLDGAKFTEPHAIVWEAKVLDPANEAIVSYSDAIVRHVALRMLESPVQMVNSTLAAGLTETFTLGNTHSGGMAFIDVNNDYLPDLYITSGAGTANRLYINVGNGQFVNESYRAQKPGPNIECAGITFGDLENDGDLDMFITVDNPAQMISFLPQEIEGGPNLLFVNDGTGFFQDRAAETGFLDPRGYRNSNNALADYDLDGCIDVYQLQWAMAAEPGADNFDRLLHNNCDGTFTDVTDQFGLDPAGRDGLGLLWWDADHDLYPELYVANNSDRCDQPVFDPEHDYWKNVGGTAFENWTHRADPTTGWDGWAGMGMDVGDIDGNGTWDVYITDVWYLPPDPQGNVLYLGNPDGTLSKNECQSKGVCYGYNSWPTNFMDFDNDGWVDLWVGASLSTEPSMMYINKGDGSGEFLPSRIEGWSGSITRAGVAADYDADGDVDVFIWSEGADSTLWENTALQPGGSTPANRHWMELRLIGRQTNWAAIGTRLEIESDGRRLLRRVTGGDSAHSQTDLAVHVGLGTDDVADSIDVYWTSGVVQRFENVAADRFWLVDEELGLVDESFTASSAVWNIDGTLTVSASTNYLGRTHIDAEGLGALSYDVTQKGFVSTFATTRPESVTLTTETGAQVTVPVTDAT